MQDTGQYTAPLAFCWRLKPSACSQTLHGEEEQAQTLQDRRARGLLLAFQARLNAPGPSQHHALTWSPLSTRYVHRCEPTKPAPPVTSTLFLSILGFVLMMVLSPWCTSTFCNHTMVSQEWAEGILPVQDHVTSCKVIPLHGYAAFRC